LERIRSPQNNPRQFRPRSAPAAFCSPQGTHHVRPLCRIQRPRLGPHCCRPTPFRSIRKNLNAAAESFRRLPRFSITNRNFHRDFPPPPPPWFVSQPQLKGQAAVFRAKTPGAIFQSLHAHANDHGPSSQSYCPVSFVFRLGILWASIVQPVVISFGYKNTANHPLPLKSCSAERLSLPAIQREVPGPPCTCGRRFGRRPQIRA